MYPRLVSNLLCWENPELWLLLPLPPKYRDYSGVLPTTNFKTKMLD